MIGSYAISKRAFTRLIEEAFTNHEICEVEGDNEDVLLSQCMEHVNVIKVDGLDDQGRAQFLEHSAESAMIPQREDEDEYDKWFWHKLKQGVDDCCSDQLVAIRCDDAEHLYYYEYFIYKVKIFGHLRNPLPIPNKVLFDDLIKKKY